MQRIAMISEHASPLTPAGSVDSGGQNVYVAQLARSLGELGHQVDVFTRRDNGFVPPSLQWLPNVRVIHVPAGPAAYVPKEELLPAMQEFGDFLLRHFRRARRPYDVVHANFFMSGLAARRAAAAFGVPLVMTFHALGRVRRVHQQTADRFPIARMAIEEDLVRCADRIIAECAQDRHDLMTLYDASPDKLDIVPCGYDPDELRPMDQAHARHSLGWEPHKFTLLQLGRLVPRKGIDNVIRALAQLRHEHRIDAQLYVVGGNSDMPDVQATPEIGRLHGIAQELGVADNVVFLGRRGREYLSFLYHAADVFVTTPWYEPFGITPVEAMACGLPVVGSAVGGIRTTVVDGVTGILVPPDDPPALAAALARLHDHPELRAAYGLAGQRRARASFTWQRVADGVLETYRRAQARRLAPARRALALEAATLQAAG